MDSYMGMIMPFAGNFAPRQWAFCNGQLMNVAQYTALFSLLGTTYGGNGQTTFALPNLNGRAIVGSGQLSGGGNYAMGQTGGAENVTLTTNQLPAHTHTLEATSTPVSTGAPGGNILGRSPQTNLYSTPEGATLPMAGAAISSVGGGQSVPTTTPYMCINYIICIEGIYPPRP